MLSRRQKISIGLQSAIYVSAGALHFLKTRSYLQIVPPLIPWKEASVYVSGAAEIAGGIGLLIPLLRKPASQGLALLLICVFPANVYMAANAVQVTEFHIPQALLWARLPVQGLLIWWVLWCAAEKRAASNKVAGSKTPLSRSN